MSKVKTGLGLIFGVLLSASHANAYDWEFWEGHPLSIHGSFGQGFVYTTDNNWQTLKTEEGSAEFNDFLLNGRISLTNKLSFGAQILSRDFGEVGNNTLKLDWANFDYAYEDWLSVRFGRCKIPLGLYGETWDIDAGRTTVFLPPTYRANFRDVFTAFNGADFYGKIDLGKAGALSYDMFAGDLKVDKDGALRFYVEELGPQRSFEEWNVDYLLGGKLNWETPVDGLMTGASYIEYQDAGSTARFDFSPLLDTPIRFDLGMDFYRQYNFYAEYTVGDWIFAAELRRDDWTLTVPMLGINRLPFSAGAYYLQGEKRWTPWLTTALGFGSDLAHWDEREEQDDARHEIYFSTRFDIKSWWMVKAEVHYVDGLKNMPSDSLIDKTENFTDMLGIDAIGYEGTPLDERKNSNLMFVMKSIVYF